jgi:y4mF family transcriptional regulator
MTKKTIPAQTEAHKPMTATDLARQLSGGARFYLQDIDQKQLVYLTENGPQAGLSFSPSSGSSKISSVADVGVLVRAARERQKLSQQAFADLAGVGRRFLSELENGKATLEFDKVLKVAAASGIDLFVKER